MPTTPRNYTLGLDLGVSSLGWAMIELDPKQRPKRILDAGVRIFEAGVEGDVEQGKDSSRAVQRREARQPRRQHWRRQHRKAKLFRLLQQHGLLPASDSDEPDVRKQVIDELDAGLKAKHIDADDHLGHQKLPYILRAKAAEGKVEPHELGRAIYNLAQRRGFLSNRKGQDEDESDGKVATGISEIDDAKGDLHLGEFFAKEVDVFTHRTTPDGDDRDPKTGRIRRRYTSRKMYREEFNAIREKQKKHFPKISKKAWDEIEDAIFFQRPLKSQKHLIGRCNLEPDRRRCPEALPVYQEFRILQQVNHLRLIDALGKTISLNGEQRAALCEKLRRVNKLSFAKTRTLLGLPKGTRFRFGEWEIDEKEVKLAGHTTNVRMQEIFEDRWFEFSEEEQNTIVLDVLHYRKPAALIKRAKRDWGLDEESAKLLARLRLEEGYGSHCKQALKSLLAAMDDGTPYTTARDELYPDRKNVDEPLEYLPQVTINKKPNRSKRQGKNSKSETSGGRRSKRNRNSIFDPDLSNPAVVRALTELRKVVNSLLRKYGKENIQSIRIELARDLKRSREERQRRFDEGNKNRRRREQAIEKILAESGLKHPNRAEVEKWLLAEECGFRCPYTGKEFSPKDLYGPNARFDVEHIFPRKYLDDSFRNKTICESNYNKNIKRDQLPSECATGDAFEAILQRVQKFSGPHAREKLRRFQVTRDQLEDGFVDRDLNDTRFNSRLAAKYLGTLFGGRVDANESQRIVTPTGGLTAKLRTAWQLNGLLNTKNVKTREDHRHHAVDALVVALSTQGAVQELSETAEKFALREQRDRAFLSGVKDPWPGFVNDARNAIEAINVSHRPTRTISGPLHGDTFYSKPYETKNGKPEYRVRKELHKLEPKDISGDKIVDPAVREAVQAKFAELKEKEPRANPKQFWSNKDDVENFPVLKPKSGTGPGTPIFKVRISVTAKPRTIGDGVRRRNVASAKYSNYAAMIYALLDKDGNESKWIHEIINRLDAHELLSKNHKKSGEKVLIPDEQDGQRRFKFALRINDMLLLDGPEGGDVLYRVQSTSINEIQLCPHSRLSIRGKERDVWTQIQTTDNLRKRNLRLVEISPIGELSIRPIDK